MKCGLNSARFIFDGKPKLWYFRQVNMKICFLVGNINPQNGGGRYASDLISAVKKSGHEVVILKKEDDGLEGIPILKPGIGIIASALKARKYLKNCDIIHALDGYPYGIIAALANRGLNKKLVITIQGTYSIAPLYSPTIGLALKWAYKKANVIISISNYTKNELLKKIVPKTEVVVINPGFDFEKFHKIPLDLGENFVLSVGALKYRKGYHVSIPAFAMAKKEIPDLKYKIVGSQEDIAYFKYLKDLASKNGIADDIEFLTGLSDEALSDLYRRAKLFMLVPVNSSKHHFEGFGLVYLEAAASGLPIIGTFGNGGEDAVWNGENGILVPQKDISATTNAIRKILSYRNLAENMSVKSYEWAKKHDLAEIIYKYSQFYKV